MIAGDKICLAERTSRNFKSRQNTERDTTSTSNDNPGLQGKNWDCQENWDYQRNKQRVARFPEKSGISKTKIETAKFIPTILARKYEGYHSKK